MAGHSAAGRPPASRRGGAPACLLARSAAGLEKVKSLAESTAVGGYLDGMRAKPVWRLGMKEVTLMDLQQGILVLVCFLMPSPFSSALLLGCSCGCDF
ncbi:unnamed protein product [Urochloa humidicola]